MQRESCDIVVLGSGFAGSLLALIARRAGLDVVMLEREAHPRFAIGESSTPLASLKLESLADAYEFPWLRPFANYGDWKRTYPKIACGLKRGFSFFHHAPGKSFRPRPYHEHELLVEANPDAERGDTHWFRSDLDAFLVERAVEAGVRYFDHWRVETMDRDAGWRMCGHHGDDPMTVSAAFAVDASGDGRALAGATGNQVNLGDLRTCSRAIYGHFKGVLPWSEVLSARGHRVQDHPFDCDASALHHIIEGGWMWVLRFDNGVTSAGFSLDPDRYPLVAGVGAEDEWRRLLAAYPSIRRQFVRADPVGPLVRTGRLQRRLERAAGEDWAALPHAACFVDPFLSAGIAHSLYGVERLGRILAEHWTAPNRAARLADYGAAVLREMRRIDRIVAGCHRSFDRFDVMVSASMPYFAAAIYSEERIRAGDGLATDEYLLAHDPTFTKTVGKVSNAVLRGTTGNAASFAQRVRRMIQPYNTAGLCDPERRNMYPFTSTM